MWRGQFGFWPNGAKTPLLTGGAFFAGALWNAGLVCGFGSVGAAGSTDGSGWIPSVYDLRSSWPSYLEGLAVGLVSRAAQALVAQYYLGRLYLVSMVLCDCQWAD